MVKVLLFVKRKEGLTREQFKQRYEEGHAPLAIKHLPLLRRYARNFLIPAPGEPEPDFDCVTEFWFDDQKAWEETAAAYAADAGQILAADEEVFMDRSSMKAFTVEERVSEI